MADPAAVTPAGMPMPGHYQSGSGVDPLPPGWDLGKDDQGVQTFLSDLPDALCKYRYISISAGCPAAGTLTDSLIGNQAILWMKLTAT